MNAETRNWVAIGDLNDIPREGARVVKTDAGCIAVFRTVDDEVYAIDDRCPHKGGPLSQGIVHGTSVTCPCTIGSSIWQPGLQRALTRAP